MGGGVSVGTIVLAEDEQHIAMLVCFALESAGFAVEHFVNGSDALARLEAGPVPAAVILDMMMPGASGLDVLTAAKTRPELARVPFLICSARAHAEDRAAALAAGAQAYVTKPFDTAELQAIVTAAVADARNQAAEAANPAASI